ncbi:hypothetical protein D6D20_09153 [Aureobasidium pullulans]|uniref:Zn(2)-C6 fungal-type domain-containing protein n=1 Tax=Aureobasidium pullulans TaxID=5580 RepID=A0A4S8YY70_AURPU|nr:hypothetical protein D6D20_09153 [Aureobasidium pullulans]
MAPAHIYHRMSEFVNAIKITNSANMALPHGNYIRYEDVQADYDVRLDYYPTKQALVALGLTLAHFDRCMHLFDVFNGGIALQALVLAKCEFRTSTFSHITSFTLSRLSINNVSLYQTPVLLDPTKPWPKIPGYWHNVLPILAHQGAIEGCELKDLRDGFTLTSPEHWAGFNLRCRGMETIKLALMNLAAGWRDAAIFMRHPVNAMEEELEAPRDEHVAVELAAADEEEEEEEEERSVPTKSDHSCKKCRKDKKGCEKIIPICGRCEGKGATCVYYSG